MAKVYNAPKPKYSRWEWFKFIGIRFFLPILLWDLVKFVANKLLGDFVGGLVLPAQNEDFSALGINDDLVHAYDEDGLSCEKHDIITYDGAHLDTFEIKHPSQLHIESKYQKYIINFVGNGECYEQYVDKMQQDAQALQANVVGFNYRGVGLSTSRARSSDELLTDGIAQVQRLLDLGVSSQNITLKAHSLGGAVASLVAKHFHELGQPINVFNSRSFSSVTNFLVGHVRLDYNGVDAYGNPIALGQKEPLGKKILGWLAKPFILFALALVKWEMDAGDAFKSIPMNYRDYFFIRSRKKIRDDRVDDAVIPHYASIHKILTSERHAQKDAIDTCRERLKNNPDPLTKYDLDNADSYLSLARKKLKKERKMMTDKEMENGHNTSWDELHNRWGASAQTFFREFVQRAADDHAVQEAGMFNI